MEGLSLIRVLASFAFVLALMLALSWVVKRFGLAGKLQKKGGGLPTLEMVENFYLDPRRRMVIVRREKKHYVLLLGQQNEVLIDSYEREIPADEKTPA